MKAQSRVKQQGRHTFIDKVKVRVVDSDYWAEVVNFGHKFVHVPEHYMRDYERLLMGGIWAQVDMRFEYDEETKGKHPFWIEKMTPIQVANFDIEEYRRARREFTTDEWIDLILRSMGYEPSAMEKRLSRGVLGRSMVPAASALLWLAMTGCSSGQGGELPSASLPIASEPSLSPRGLSVNGLSLNGLSEEGLRRTDFAAAVQGDYGCGGNGAGRQGGSAEVTARP